MSRLSSCITPFASQCEGMEYVHTLQASGRNLMYNSAGIPPAQLELQQSSDGSLPTRAAHRRLDRRLYDLGSRFSTCFYLLRILPSLRPRTPGSPSGCGWYVTTGRGVRLGVGCRHHTPTTITCDAHPSQVPGHAVCGTKAERLLHIDVKAAHGRRHSAWGRSVTAGMRRASSG